MDERPHARQASPSLAGASLALCCALTAATAASCATPVQTVTRTPISNPFGEVVNALPGSPAGEHGGDSIVFRTRKGDRAVEVEIPNGTRDLSDLVVPMSAAFPDRGPAQSGAGGGESGLIDERYRERRATLTDREIAGSLPSSAATASPDRQLVEQELGVMASTDPAPVRDGSYLAAVDHVKQLYRNARFEAALLEVDDLLRLYPTDPKLHEMRGTLLDRTGRIDLALRSWNQALSLSPDNASLRRFVERKQLTRSLAGQRGTPAPAETSPAPQSVVPPTTTDSSLQEGANSP